MTAQIAEEELPVEARRYQYRVCIKRGTRLQTIQREIPPPTLSRKRERDFSMSLSVDERSLKRPREDDHEVILLSSDGDEPVIARHPAQTPVTISSTTDESEEVAYSVSDELDNFDDTLVDDLDESMLSWVEKKETIAEASGSSTPDKGKGKEIVMSTLDLQDELECFICCILRWNEADYSDVNGCSIYLFSMRPWSMWSLQ